MAQMTEVQNTLGSVHVGVTGLFANLQDAFAKRRLYNQTLNELQNLNDRELDDLGLSRYNIKSVAYETAYSA
ncbi:MAG: DUF1127 domain-containing protein [Planktomarina sp.]